MANIIVTLRNGERLIAARTIPAVEAESVAANFRKEGLWITEDKSIPASGLTSVEVDYTA